MRLRFFPNGFVDCLPTWQTALRINPNVFVSPKDVGRDLKERLNRCINDSGIFSLSRDCEYSTPSFEIEDGTNLRDMLFDNLKRQRRKDILSGFVKMLHCN
ncbi:MAG: hypothetical protein ACKV2Q_28370 [Planctomycetaceae bacterium]